MTFTNFTPTTFTDATEPLISQQSLNGWLFADKGYLGQGFLEKLKNQSMEIFTKVKKNTRTNSTILFEQKRIN